MAKPNYTFEKRQRDLAKKAKQDAKRQRKTESRENPQGTDQPDADAPAPATDRETSDEEPTS